MAPDILGTAKRLETELGLDPETALRYADAIGDTPEYDADGSVLVKDDKGEIMARISIAVLQKAG